MHYEGPWMQVYYPLIKISLAIAIFAVMQIFFGKWWISALTVMAVTMLYPYWVASVVPNTIVMPAMDTITYVSNPNQLVNYMNCSTYDSPDPDLVQNAFRKSIEQMPKFRYKVKEIMGDYYYEEMSIEETCKKALLRPESPDKILKSQAEIDEYIRDNMNEKMPLDGPLVRVYYQPYNPID